MKKSNTWFHHVKGYDDDDDGEDDYDSDDESEVDDLVPGCGQPQALQPLLLPQQIIFNLEQHPIIKVDMKIKLKPFLIPCRAQQCWAYWVIFNTEQGQVSEKMLMAGIGYQLDNDYMGYFAFCQKTYLALKGIFCQILNINLNLTTQH